MGVSHQEEGGYVSRSVFGGQKKPGPLRGIFSPARVQQGKNRSKPRQKQPLQNQCVYVVSSLRRSHLRNRGTTRWRDADVSSDGGRRPRGAAPGRFNPSQPRTAERPAPRLFGRQKRRLLCPLAPVALGLPRYPRLKPAARARSSKRAPARRRAGATAVPRRRGAAHTLPATALLAVPAALTRRFPTSARLRRARAPAVRHLPSPTAEDA